MVYKIVPLFFLNIMANETPVKYNSTTKKHEIFTSGDTIDPQFIGPTSPNGVAGGDLNGNYPNPTVDGIQGVPVNPIAPTIGQVLAFNGTQYAPTTLAKAYLVATATVNTLLPNGVFTIINYNSIESLGNGITSLGGGQFRVPRTGNYIISAGFLSNSVSFTATSGTDSYRGVQLELFINSVRKKILDYSNIYQTAGLSVCRLGASGAIVLSINANDIVDIRGFSGGINGTIQVDAIGSNHHHFTIHEI